jgi:ParB family chromosome partitioning protein
MGSEIIAATGAVGRTDMLFFWPEDLILVEDPKHPLWDPRVLDPVDEKIVRSMMTVGYLPEPVVVRKNGRTAEDKPIVEVVDGRHRVTAAREANRRLRAAGREPIRVQAIVRQGNEELYGIGVAMNAPKKRDSVIARAHSMRHQLDLGDSEDRVAVCHGVTVRQMRATLALLDCSAKVQAAVERREIVPKAARALAHLPREEQDAALQKMRASGDLGPGKSTEAAEKAKGPVRGKKKPQKRCRSWKEVDRVRRALQDALDSSAPGQINEITGKFVIFLLAWVQGEDPRKDLRAWIDALKAKKP